MVAICSDHVVTSDGLKALGTEPWNMPINPARVTFSDAIVSKSNLARPRRGEGHLSLQCARVKRTGWDQVLWGIK